MTTRSIRWRLTLWFAGTSVFVIILLAAVVLIVERAVLERMSVSSLAKELGVLTVELQNTPQDLDRAARDGLSEAYAIWNSQSTFYTSPGWRHLSLDQRSIIDGLQNVGTKNIRILRSEIALDGDSLTVAVAHDETVATKAITWLSMILLGALPIAAAGTLIMGWIVAGRALEPTRALRRDLERITAERLDERISVGHPDDEFGRLSTVLNRMLTRLQQALNAQRHFAADASHQLRSPLTAQRAIGELALSRHLANPDQLANAIASMLEEADRLNSLTSGLLALASTENARLTLTNTDVSAVVRRVIDRLEPLIETAGHHIEVDLREAVALTNPDALARAVTGIIENAITHCPPPAHIRISIQQTNRGVRILVQDDGPGISEDEHESIFQPFYRGKCTQGRPGVGLGLPLARAAAMAAGAELSLIPSDGAAFEICIPAITQTDTR